MDPHSQRPKEGLSFRLKVYPHGLLCNAVGVRDDVRLTGRVLAPRADNIRPYEGPKGKGRADEDIGPYGW